MSTAPMSDPQTMPLDQLRQQVAAPSDPPAPSPTVEPTPAAPAAPAPTPAPTPEPFSVQQDDSGITVQMGPEYGGEVFKGKDWAEIGPKIAKAKADANAYIKQLKATPAATPTPATPTEPQAPALTKEQEEAASVRRWMVELFKEDPAAAKELVTAALGIPIDNLVKASQDATLNATIAEFHSLCPDYVDTPENTAVITSYLNGLNHMPTSADLKQAYAMALLDGKIQRGTAPAAGAPKIPPPMPGSTASPTSGGDNPWTMDKEALKRQAFGQ